MQHVVKVFLRNVDIREHLDVRTPAYRRAGLLPVGGLYRELLALLSDYLAFLEVQGIFVSVAPDRHVHVFGCVLRRAGTETVETEGKFIVAARVVFVLAAGVQLAEDQLPVVALLVRVPVERAAASEVRDFYGFVLKVGESDKIAVALSRLVDGV